MSELHGWVGGPSAASAHARIVIYAADGAGGNPGTRLAYTNETTYSADTEIAQTGFSVSLPAADYWIGWLCISIGSGGAAQVYADTSTGSYVGLSSGASNPPPAPFGTPDQSGTGKLSCWAVVTAAASVPVADFTGTPLTGVEPLGVAFTDTSTNTPTSWAWTFGDGGTSSSQNPTHSYTVPGTYTVVLVATNAAGSNTKTRTGYVVVSDQPRPVRINTSNGWVDIADQTAFVSGTGAPTAAIGATGAIYLDTAAGLMYGPKAAGAWPGTAIPDGLGVKVDKDSVVAAATRVVQSMLAGGDTQPAWRILGSGRMDWGPGGSTAVDTALYRSAAAALKTDGLLTVAGDINGLADVYSRQGNTTAQIGLTANGIYFGTALDTRLYRLAAAVLKTDGQFRTTNEILGPIGPSGESGLRLGGDTNLFRSAANVVKSDGSILAAISLGVAVGGTGALLHGGLINSNTNGVNSGWKMPIYNAAATLIGYIPIHTG
jgi:PKD repeat protein